MILSILKVPIFVEYAYEVNIDRAPECTVKNNCGLNEVNSSLNTYVYSSLKGCSPE